MNKNKHTPGPWICQQYAKCFGIKAVSGRQIAIMTEHYGDEPNTPMHQFDRSTQDAADANLIAAAPAMLEALEFFANEGDTTEMPKVMARKLIAKAKGEKYE